MDISSRFPKQKEIAPVYAVIVLLVYGWTLLRFTYNIPGWLYFLNLGEVTTLLAYSMVTNLLESLLVLFIVLALTLILPRKWFSDAFIARGAGLSILVLSLMMVIASQFHSRDDYPAGLIRWSLVILILIAVAIYWLGRSIPIRRALEWLADRAVIFLYITVPVSLVSILIILFRLVLQLMMNSEGVG